MAAAQAGSPLSGNCVDLIDEHDAGGIFLCLLKQVSDPGGAHAYEHLHKVGTGDAEKRNSRLPCNRLGKQRLSCSRRAHQKNALGNPGAYVGVLLGISKKIHKLLQVFFLLPQACHLFKIVLARIPAESGPAFSEIHHPGIGPASARSGIHHHKHRHQNHPGQEDRHHHGQEIALLGHVSHGTGNSQSHKVLLLFLHVGHIDQHLIALAGGQKEFSRGSLPVGAYLRRLDGSLLRRLHVFLLGHALIAHVS